MLSAVKLWKSSSICGPFGDGEAHLAEDRDDLVDGLADRMDAAIGLGAHRQGHVDALAGEPLTRAPRPRAGAAARPIAVSTSSLSTLSAAPRSRRASGSSAPSPFISAGDAALAAEDGDADLLERVAARRRLDQAEDLVAELVEAFHAIVSDRRILLKGQEKGAESQVSAPLIIGGHPALA